MGIKLRRIRVTHTLPVILGVLCAAPAIGEDDSNTDGTQQSSRRRRPAVVRVEPEKETSPAPVVRSYDPKPAATNQPAARTPNSSPQTEGDEPPAPPESSATRRSESNSLRNRRFGKTNRRGSPLRTRTSRESQAPSRRSDPVDSAASSDAETQTPARAPSYGSANSEPRVVRPAPRVDVDAAPESEGISPIPSPPVRRIEIPEDIQVSPAYDPVEDSDFALKSEVEVRTSSFQEITPGQSTLAVLDNAFGQPRSKENGAWVYQVGPFPRVEMLTGDDIVQAIVIQLERPTALKTVEEELDLGQVTAGEIVGDDGETLGAVYPERGIVLSYAQPTKPRTVTQIMLEPVNAELFMVRARNTTNWQQRLADVRYARKLDDRLAESHYLEAKIQEQLGRYHSAKQAMDKALGIQQDARHALYRAQLQWRLGDQEAAQASVEEIAGDKAVPELTLAAAESILGDMAANGKQHDFAGAFQKHMKALRIAGKFVESESRADRMEAKTILVDAHLGVAGDLAWGEWRQKEQAVPKWVAIAKKAVTSLIEVDGSPADIKLSFFRRNLVAYSAFSAEMGQDRVADEALQFGRDLIAEADDPLRKRAAKWQLIESLYFASRCMQRQKKFDEALQLGETAAALLEQTAKEHKLTSSQRYLAGRVMFHVGSVLAINQRAHFDAVNWYQKTLPHFAKIDKQLEASIGAIGDRCVSMGVSFWQTNQRKEAVKITERGARMLEMAVKSGRREPASMSIPLNNLVSMYEALGDEDRASSLAEKAKRYEAAARQDDTESR